MGLFKDILSFLTNNNKRETTHPTVRLKYELRYDDDPDYVVRMIQNPPPDIPFKIAEYVKVTGISLPIYCNNAIHFINGYEQRLELLPDPNNQHDKNAIKAIGLWEDASSRNYKAQLGWVDAKVASQISKISRSSKLFASIKTIYKPHDDNSPGIRFDIYSSKEL